MALIIVRRSRFAHFGINSEVARRVKVVVMPPLPPRPKFFAPIAYSNLSADSVALKLGMVRKFNRQTGKFHFEQRQLRDLQSKRRQWNKDQMIAKAQTDAATKAEALRKWAAQ
jgi:hypothetical protein